MRAASWLCRGWVTRCRGCLLLNYFPDEGKQRAHADKLKRNKAISLSVAAVLGAVIWAMSPVVTGAVEPWDADSPYYFISLFAAGAFLGGLFPRHVWVVFPGIVAGQLIYMLAFLPRGPLLPLGILFLVGYGVLSLVGAALVARIRRGPARA